MVHNFWILIVIVCSDIENYKGDDEGYKSSPIPLLQHFLFYDPAPHMHVLHQSAATEMFYR